MNEYHDFLDVDTFTVGAVGQPGARTFFLQAQHAGNRVTVKCEKQQAGAIAEYLRKVLSDLPPAPTAAAPMDLAVPFESAFVLGPVGLGYDRDSDRVLVQLEEFAEVDDDGEPIDDDLRGKVRLFLTRSQASAFCQQADHVVSAGRAPCHWCGQPINPDGHACPRMN